MTYSPMMGDALPCARLVESGQRTCTAGSGRHLRGRDRCHAGCVNRSDHALAGFLRYRFAQMLDMSFAPHQRGGEMIRLTVAGVDIAVLGVATALIIAIDRFA